MKVFGIIVIALALLVVILVLFGGGNHGPSRHSMPSIVVTDHAPTEGAGG